MLRRDILKVMLAAAAVGMAGAAQAQEVRWTFLAIQPLTQPHLAEIAAGFKRIEERSQGRFVIQASNIRETPHNPADGLSIIRDGLADVMEWYPGYVTNTYPALAGAELPFLVPAFGSIADGAAATKRAWESPSVKQTIDEIFATHGAVTGVRVQWEPHSFFANQPIATPTNLGGMALRANTREMGDMINALGGVAQFIPVSEVYAAAQRNVINGVSASAVTILSQKLFEVLKHGIVVQGQFTTGRFLVRQAAIDALPADLRQIYDEEMAETQRRVDDLTVESEPAARAELVKMGFDLRELTQEEYAAMREVARNTVWTAWKERVGTDGDRILQEIEQAIGQ